MPTLKYPAEDWARVDMDDAARWTGELTCPLVYLAAIDPYPGPRPFSYFSNYPLDVCADAVVDRAAPVLAATRFYAAARPYGWLTAPALSRISSDPWSAASPSRPRQSGSRRGNSRSSSRWSCIFQF